MLMMNNVENFRQILFKFVEKNYCKFLNNFFKENLFLDNFINV